MAKLIWSPQAIDDLDAICSYIERGSNAYARLFGERLISLAESIPLHPLLGAVVPEYMREDLRERRLQNYRLIYRIVGDTIQIVTIAHGAKPLPPV
ncbi:MAG TPA: type II toxin-antitoxin system RelE/ParE family toxin [Pirellulales bacterium]|nr:type II toxin-antitoxin system RelE/ParE family toxin [Pirellulales bacterium]